MKRLFGHPVTRRTRRIARLRQHDGKRADGIEILFLGDVAWQHRNIDVQRQRARLVTQFMLKEDRDAVMLQLVELKRLREAEPKLEIMPGHDPDSLDHFLSTGLLVKGFK